MYLDSGVTGKQDSGNPGYIKDSTKTPTKTPKHDDVVEEKNETTTPKTKTTTTTQDDKRSQNLNLIKSKLGIRHSNTPKDEEVDLLTECFAEDPSRDLWLDLPPARVRALIHQSQKKKKTTRFGTFKGFFIEALDLEAQTDTVKTTTTAPPVAAAPPRRALSEESEKMLRESMGDELYEQINGRT